MTGSLTSQLHEGISNYLSISKIWRCWPFPFTGPAKHLLHVKPSWKMKSILYWRRISFINSDRSWVWGLNTTNSCSTERLARASEVHCQNMEKRYGLISIIIPFCRFDESCQSWNFLNALFFAVWLFALFCMPNCWGQIAMSPFSRSLHQPSWTRCWSGVAVEPSGFCAQTGSGSWDRFLFARSQSGQVGKLYPTAQIPVNLNIYFA